MSTQGTPDLDATVDDEGDVVIPGDRVAEVVDVRPGDRVRVRIVGKEHPRRNMYGVFADAPIGLDPDDLRQVREQMWKDLGTDTEA